MVHLFFHRGFLMNTHFSLPWLVQIVKMESDILECLEFAMGGPTIDTFVWYYFVFSVHRWLHPLCGLIELLIVVLVGDSQGQVKKMAK